jgi:hypothetical protein
LRQEEANVVLGFGQEELDQREVVEVAFVGEPSLEFEGRLAQQGVQLLQVEFPG